MHGSMNTKGMYDCREFCCNFQTGYLKRIVAFGKFEWTGEKAVGTNLKIISWRLPTEMEENHPEGQ